MGVGIALYVEPCGSGWESGRISLAADGKIIAATGSSSQGQGRETAYAQIVGEVLQIAAEQIAVVHGDTGETPAGIGALASRSTAIGGSALKIAATRFLDRARLVAAAVAHVPANSLHPVARRLCRCRRHALRDAGRWWRSRRSPTASALSTAARW